MTSNTTRHYFETSYPNQTIEVYLMDQLIARSNQTILLKESGLQLYDPIYYFPKEDVKTALFKRAITQTSCPIKGTASYFSYQDEQFYVPDLAWNYETAITGAEIIEGKFAFKSEFVSFRIISDFRPES